jgi:hypothetical protein
MTSQRTENSRHGLSRAPMLPMHRN